jgi:Ca2+/Na+ antiporter
MSSALLIVAGLAGLFILGLSALIRPIAFERRTLRFDLPAMTVACLALWLLALDGSLSRVDQGRPVIGRE